MPDTTTILYLDNSSTFGGAINSLLYLVRGIDKTRFTPVLVTAQPEEFLSCNFDFIQWRRMRIKRSWINNRIYKSIIRTRLFSSGIAYKGVNRIRFLYWLLFITLPEALQYWRIGYQHKVRIVHLNNIMGSQMAGILSAKFLGVPCVAHLRNFEEVDYVTKLYAKMIDTHIAISGAIKENLLRLSVPEEKITVIYDAIDLEVFDDSISCGPLQDEFHLKGQEKIFGIFGRIVPWKGIKEFVHAAALIIRSLPEAIAFIVGDCSDGDVGYFEEVNALITQYGLERNIVLTGYRKDVPAFMQLMDVVVHASTAPEPFGMVLIEAMAMKKPVVATRMGGPLDIILDGQTGYLVSPGNAAEMADAVLCLLQNRERAYFMGQQGKARVASLFTKERYAQQVEAVYNKILGSD